MNALSSTFASTLLAASIGALVLASADVRAQDAANGSVLYAQNCSTCHLGASLNVSGVLAGANPNVILAEIQAYPPMRFLAPNAGGPITSVSQINDIAAYLAQVAGGGGGTPPIGTFSASPPSVGFAALVVGATSAAVTVTLSVHGDNGTIVSIASSNTAEFILTGGSCLAPLPHPLSEDAACTVDVMFAPTAEGARAGTLMIADSGTPDPLLVNLTGTGIGGGSGPGAKVVVVEYYNVLFNHYFITPNATEIALLGHPPFQDWQPTGLSFAAYPPAGHPATTVAVCRFYNDHFLGISTHFYAPHGLGCEATISQFPDWTLEDPQLFYASLPSSVDGSCPAGEIPVYRLYNNNQGGAPNHRFTTSAAVRQQMLDHGYIPEGYGIGVGWCAPQ